MNKKTQSVNIERANNGYILECRGFYGDIKTVYLDWGEAIMNAARFFEGLKLRCSTCRLWESETE